MFGIPTLFVVFAISAVPSSEPAAQTNTPLPELRLLQFGSANCSVCAKIKPLIDDFVEKKWPIQYIDAYENRDLAKKYHIEEIPTFIMLVGDTEADRTVGVLDRTELRNRLIEMFKNAAELRKQEGDKAPTQILRGTSESSQTLGHPSANNGFSQSSSIAQTSYDSPVSFQQQAPQQQAPQQQQHLVGEPKVDSTVRIRVDDPKGLSWGTGTIIDTYNGEALILTCGHIFRESQGKGPVEVHLFRENSFVKVYGECDAYDLDVDLGLVVIKNIPFPVQATPIAQTDTLREGQKLLSVGCDGGANPSVREHTVLSLNRFGTASNASQRFHYIQVSGAPVQGRSGGGLFSEDGFLVGVCNTGDPKTNDGLFVPLSVIRSQLDARGLSAVYQSPSVVDPRAADPRAMAASQNQTATDTSPFAPIPTGSISADAISANPAPSIANPALITQNERQPIITASNAGEQSLPKAKIALAANESPQEELSETEIATLEEIRRRRADGAEVILIVNPPRKGNETPQSEVIKLGAVSGRFIDALTERDAYSVAEPMPSLTEQAAAIARSNLGQGQGTKPSVPSRQREATVRALRSETIGIK